jgi:hypothetical protein
MPGRQEPAGPNLSLSFISSVGLGVLLVMGRSLMHLAGNQDEPVVVADGGVPVGGRPRRARPSTGWANGRRYTCQTWEEGNTISPPSTKARTVTVAMTGAAIRTERDPAANPDPVAVEWCLTARSYAAHAIRLMALAGAS